VTYRGRDVTHALRRLPIAFIHQDLGLIEWMTVAENISLMLGFPRRFGMIDWNATSTRAEEALKVVGADIDPERRVHHLTRTEKSLVAIARALAADAEILVLDEPTASLPANEVARLFTALRLLRARGVGMIYVSHRLDEVFEIADRMVILRDGRLVAERRVSETSAEEAILLIVGREPSQVFRRPARHEGSARLVFEQLTTDDAGPFDCRMRAGRGGRPVGTCAAPVRKASAARCSGSRARPPDESCSTDARSPHPLHARPSVSASTWSAPIGSRSRSFPACRFGRTCSSTRWPPVSTWSRISGRTRNRAPPSSSANASA
jgi:ABC-type lipoprotein export system ATPase subunit